MMAVFLGISNIKGQVRIFIHEAYSIKVMQSMKSNRRAVPF